MPQFRFFISPTAPRRHAGCLNIDIDHRAGTPCLLAVSMFGRWKLWQVAKSCGRKGVPIVSSRIIALLFAILALLLTATLACFPTLPGGEHEQEWPIPELSVDTQGPARTSVAIEITNPSNRTGSWYGHCRYRKSGNPIARLSDVHVTANPVGPMQSETLTIAGLTEGARYHFRCYLDTQRGRIQGVSTSRPVTAIP